MSNKSKLKTDKTLLRAQIDDENEGQDNSSEINLEQKLNEILENRKTTLSQIRFELDKNLSYGELIEQQSCCVRLTKIKGKFVHYMGHCNYHGSPDKNSTQNIILHPEEALFLIESSSLQILNKNGFPISIQEAYGMFLNENKSDLKLENYLAYSILSKLGFIVVRSPYRGADSCLEAQTNDDDLKNETVEDDDDNEPLLKPQDWHSMSTNEIFNKIDIIKSYPIDTLSKKFKSTKESEKLSFKAAYDVYLPDKKFKKTNPGVPIYRIILHEINPTNPFLITPRLHDLVVNTDSNNQNIKLLFTFLDNGSVLFYNFLNINLPIVYNK